MIEKGTPPAELRLMRRQARRLQSIELTALTADYVDLGQLTQGESLRKCRISKLALTATKCCWQDNASAGGWFFNAERERRVKSCVLAKIDKNRCNCRWVIIAPVFLRH